LRSGSNAPNEVTMQRLHSNREAGMQHAVVGMRSGEVRMHTHALKPRKLTIWNALNPHLWGRNGS